VLASLRRPHFDIAMSANRYTLPSLAAFADPANVLFGSDFPFMPPSTTEETVVGLAKSPEWTDEQKAGIGRDNALRLRPRLAARIQALP
jgi:predicted TIM-barrel fold metal-dependent hydrolase